MCVGLVQGSLAEAMTDSLRTGQSVTEQLAKELLVDALEDPEAALAIKHILANDSLRASTRGLIYWLVREPWTVEETNKLLTWQLDYLLKDNKWTVQTLAKTAEWLLGTEVRMRPRAYGLPGHGHVGLNKRGWWAAVGAGDGEGG